MKFYVKQNHTDIPRSLYEQLTFTCQMVNTCGVQAIALYAFQFMSSSSQPYEIKSSRYTDAEMKAERGKVICQALPLKLFPLKGGRLYKSFLSI